MPNKEPTSRLLDLPPELRNAIYTAVFEGSTTFIEHTSNFSRKYLAHTTSSGHQSKGLPRIIFTNRQIRAECEHLFYSLTKWTGATESTLFGWLLDVPPKFEDSVERIAFRLHEPHLLRMTDAKRVRALAEARWRLVRDREDEGNYGFDLGEVGIELWVRDGEGKVVVWTGNE